MFNILFNNKTNDEFGVVIPTRPVRPSTKKRYTTSTVSGRDGDLYEDENAVEDVSLSISFNFISEDEYVWNDMMRKISYDWLEDIVDNKLIMSDDIDWCYIVKKFEKSEIQRALYRMGGFTLTFTCEGYQYLRSAYDTPIVVSGNSIYNQYSKTAPIYILKGTGSCDLTVNGKTMNATVNQKLTIDTEHMESYNDQGASQNTVVTGNYDDLYLNHGTNTISVSSGFTLEIIPRWRVKL